MSKLQSSIQKAISKSRENAGKPASRKRNAPDRTSGSDTAAPANMFKVFQLAFPRQDVMKESLIVSAIDDRAAKSAYDLLRTRVLQRMRGNSWRTLLVTSPGPGEGKTLTSSNLAISISRDVNQSVVLVDLDLRRSSIAKYLGIDVDIKAGVGDFLNGDAEISDIVYTPGEMPRIALLPNREPLDNASDLLGSPRMKDLVAWLRDQSDRSIVIFDMPPVLACDDVLAFSSEADAILLVAAQGITDRGELETTVNMAAASDHVGHGGPGDRRRHRDDVDDRHAARRPGLHRQRQPAPARPAPAVAPGHLRRRHRHARRHRTRSDLDALALRKPAARRGGHRRRPFRQEPGAGVSRPTAAWRSTAKSFRARRPRPKAWRR